MKTSKNLTVVAALAACLILAGATAVMAQRPGGRTFDPEQMFDRMDTNKDGNVSKQEFNENFQRRRGGEDNAQRGDNNNRRSDPMQRFRQGMLDRLKEQLKVKDDEWTVLQPRIEKVMELQRETRMGAGPRWGNTEAAPEVEALRKALDNDKTSPEELKKKTEAVRDARKKKEAELETARKELREILTTRQEAVLVLNGMLD